MRAERGGAGAGGCGVPPGCWQRLLLLRAVPGSAHPPARRAHLPAARALTGATWAWQKGSKGAGHFGYGLLCEADGAGAGARFACGVHVGARTDPTGARALAELCPEIGSGGDFCGEGRGYTAAHRLTTGARAVVPGAWVHLAASYDAATGLLLLAVDGEEAARASLTYTDPATNASRPLPIAYLVSLSPLSPPQHRPRARSPP